MEISEVIQYWPYAAAALGGFIVFGAIANAVDKRLEKGTDFLSVSKEYLTTKAKKDIFLACTEEEKRRHAGDLGEIAVNDELERLQYSATYWQVEGECFNKRFEFDHMVVLPGSIHIIETKNYSGAISDKTQNGAWVRLDDHCREVKNPFRQLDRHLRLLREMLDHWGLDIPTFGVVAMTGNCDLSEVERVKYPITPIVHVRQAILDEAPRQRDMDVVRFCAMMSVLGIEPIIFDQRVIE